MSLSNARNPTVAEKDYDRKIIEVFEKVSDLLRDLTTRGARYITRVARVICLAPRLNMPCPTTCYPVSHDI